MAFSPDGRGRFAARGLGSLKDLPRSGRPRRISELERAAVCALACQLPAATGVPLARWSGPELAAEITAQGLVSSISASSVARILGEHPIKPWQYQSWIHPRDPDFAAKATVILDLYQGFYQGQPLRPGDRILSFDGAGASHGMIARLDTLAARRGNELTDSVGLALGEREKTALRLIPEHAWQAAIYGRGEVRERRAPDACANTRCAHRACWIEEAHVTELTGLLREGLAGDQLASWPAAMRIFARRERPHPGAQLTLFDAADGWRCSLWATNRDRARVDGEGLASSPWDRRSSLSWAVSTIVKPRPNLASISSRHLSVSDAGQTTMTRRARCLSSISCTTKPASIVLPRPTSSAMSRLTLGMARAPLVRAARTAGVLEFA